MAQDKPTSDRAQEAIEEHRARLWRQRQIFEQLIRDIDRDLARLDELVGVVAVSRPRKIIDHIVPFLEEQGKALADDQLVHAMLRTAAGAGRRDSAKQIRDSISANMAPRNPNPKLKRLHNLVGLAEWTEDKFKGS